MKRELFLPFIFTLSVCACSQQQSDNERNSKVDSATSSKQDLNLQVNNALKDKNIEILATRFIPPVEKKRQYHFTLTINNTSEQPISLSTEQIFLVDSNGKEHIIKLTDRELVRPILPGNQVSGIIGFEYDEPDQPAFIKIKS
nr:DUF4352 domain-containing protein [Acinetobacter sp. Marseille-Q1620]